MGVNDFASADLRFTPSSVINTDITNITALLALRFSGTNPEAAESYTINGRTEQRTRTVDLYMLRGLLYRTLALQGYEPDGVGISLAQMGDATTGRSLPNNSGPSGF